MKTKPGSAVGAILLAVLFSIVAVDVAAIFIGESISISQTLPANSIK